MKWYENVINVDHSYHLSDLKILNAGQNIKKKPHVIYKIMHFVQ